MVAHLIEVREPGRATLRLVVTDRLVVGRAGEGLLLGDERLSRRHCELMVGSDGELAVVDCGSSNGTFVGDRRVDSRVPVLPGDEIRIGDTLIVVAGRLDALPPGRGSATTADESVDGPDAIDLWATVAGDRLRSSMVGGTITLVFSDISGSTVRNGVLGDRAWLELLRRHDELLRRILVANGGTEVKSLGDGFILTFPSARRGLTFAVDVQRALAAERIANAGAPEDGLHLTIGVHTGEVLHVDGDVFGRHVHLAARVASVAAPDEIVASELVHQLVAPMGEFAFGPKRAVSLKGFDGLVAVRTVGWESGETPSSATHPAP